MGYKLKVSTSSLEEQRDTLKEGFHSIHNGLKNINSALDGLETKGLKGKAAEGYEELVNIVKADVIAPTERYNDLVLVDLNAAAIVFKDL